MVIAFLPTQFALDLQLLGGVIWILRTFRHWYSASIRIGSAHPGYLLAGSWASSVARIFWIKDRKPLQLISLGGAPFTVYIGLLALIANIAVAAALSSFKTKVEVAA